MLELIETFGLREYFECVVTNSIEVEPLNCGNEAFDNGFLSE